jgi:hypothetical protein
MMTALAGTVVLGWRMVGSLGIESIKTVFAFVRAIAHSWICVSCLIIVH